MTLNSPHPSYSSDEKDIDLDATRNESALPGTEITDHDDYPDGGLRAWLIVLGVRLYYMNCVELRPLTPMSSWKDHVLYFLNVSQTFPCLR